MAELPQFVVLMKAGKQYIVARKLIGSDTFEKMATCESEASAAHICSVLMAAKKKEPKKYRERGKAKVRGIPPVPRKKMIREVRQPAKKREE